MSWRHWQKRVNKVNQTTTLTYWVYPVNLYPKTGKKFKFPVFIYFNAQIRYKYALFSPKTTTRVIDNVSHTSIPAADPRTIGHYNRSVYGMFCPAIPWQLTLSLRPTLNISVFPNLFIFISFHFLNWIHVRLVCGSLSDH